MIITATNENSEKLSNDTIVGVDGRTGEGGGRMRLPRVCVGDALGQAHHLRRGSMGLRDGHRRRQVEDRRIIDHIPVHGYRYSIR